LKREAKLPPLYRNSQIPIMLILGLTLMVFAVLGLKFLFKSVLANR